MYTVNSSPKNDIDKKERRIVGMVIMREWYIWNRLYKVSV